MRRFLLAAALALGIPATASAQATSLQLTVFSAAFHHVPGQASVLVGAEAHRPDARPVHISFTVAGESAPGRAMQVDAGGNPARALARLPLPPGRHQLTVVARDMVTGADVTATHHVDVPNLIAGPLTAGGLLLASSATRGVTHADADEDRVLPIVLQPPTGRREFSHDEKVEVQVEIYQQESDDAYQMDVTTRVRDLAGKAVWETTDIGQSEPLTGGRFGYTHSTLLPVRALAPGRYVVEVSATVTAGPPLSVSRTETIVIVADPAR